MFGGHIASKFAQIFTLKTEVRLPCCLQITLSITILIQNKLHSGSNKKHQKKKKRVRGIVMENSSVTIARRHPILHHHLHARDFINHDVYIARHVS